jgi:hypothetical protein
MGEESLLCAGKREGLNLTDIVPADDIERRIYMVRGHRVMLDSDLAVLYGVTTGNLNKAVKRQQRRFPDDFMFQLLPDEWEILLFQIGRPKGRGGRQTPPYAFTQEGVAMLSGILDSEQAVQVNIGIMRVFVKLREQLAASTNVVRQLAEVKRQLQAHDQKFRDQDQKFEALITAIQALMEPLEPPAIPEPEPEPPSKPMGFRPKGKREDNPS